MFQKSQNSAQYVVVSLYSEETWQPLEDQTITEW